MSQIQQNIWLYSYTHTHICKMLGERGIKEALVECVHAFEVEENSLSNT